MLLQSVAETLARDVALGDSGTANLQDCGCTPSQHPLLCGTLSVWTDLRRPMYARVYPPAFNGNRIYCGPAISIPRP